MGECYLPLLTARQEDMRSNSTPLFISCMTLKKLFNFVTLDILIYKMGMMLPSNLTVLFARTN